MKNKFRPQHLGTKFIMRERRKYGALLGAYNWQTRIRWYPAGWGFNKQVIGRQFGRLHYLACHAPEPVAKRWKHAYNNFHAKYFASKGKASMRYLNQHTAHSWL